MKQLITPRSALRPWRGLPHQRCLDTFDLSWFMKPEPWWRTQRKTLRTTETLVDAMRHIPPGV